MNVADFLRQFEEVTYAVFLKGLALNYTGT